MAAQPACRNRRSPQPSPPPQAQPQEQEPPEEDQSFKPKEYDFNPLKATQSITAGNFYFKKGNFAAAKGRYQGRDSLRSRFGGGVLRSSAKRREAARFRRPPAMPTPSIWSWRPTAKDAEAIKKRMEKLPASSKVSAKK